jgi:hypothetical protein
MWLIGSRNGERRPGQNHRGSSGNHRGQRSPAAGEATGLWYSDGLPGARSLPPTDRGIAQGDFAIVNGIIPLTNFQARAGSAAWFGRRRASCLAFRSRRCPCDKVATGQ